MTGDFFVCFLFLFTYKRGLSNSERKSKNKVTLVIFGNLFKMYVLGGLLNIY